MTNPCDNTLISACRNLLIICLFSSVAWAKQPEPNETPSSSLSVRGSLDSVTFAVNGIKRNVDGTLTVSVKIQGKKGIPVHREAIGFDGDTPWHQDYKLLDLVNKKRYLMLKDSTGRCLCTHLSDEELSELGLGQSKDINIKFPLPPANITNITVELPHAEPIDRVPIAD